MTAGVITQVTNSGDAKWGKIRLTGFSREVFFSSRDFINSRECEQLAPGHRVEFEEQPNREQGMRAVNIRLIQQKGV